MRALLVLLLAHLAAAAAEGDGVPAYAIRGIARVETRSYWDDAGAFRYIDRRDGAAGEAGPFQMTPSAFATVRRAGERFGRLRTSPAFACRLALRYLAWLRARSADWDAAIGAYNAGLGGSPGASSRYLLAVQTAAGVQ